jgi:hypothetical protein
MGFAFVAAPASVKRDKALETRRGLGTNGDCGGK